MKSLAELKAIRDKARAELDLRKENPNAARVLVGMATCGIAAGARPVLNAFVEEIAKRGLTNDITVTQTGCIGICQYEPVVEVEIPGQEKVTYVKVAPEMVSKIVNDHLVSPPADNPIKTTYGIMVHPLTHDIYIMDATNYVSSGKLYCFDHDGNYKWVTWTGDIPGHAVFLEVRDKR